MNWLTQLWYKKNPLCNILIPFSLLYGLFIFLHRIVYLLKIKKTHHFPLPIIVIGNLTVGGTGKTPAVIWMAEFLRSHGFRPGIVSRGHGGIAAEYPQIVSENSDPRVVSDEAVLIVKRTHCPMVVDPNRVNAVKKLLANNDCNIVISDDGLQHYAMGRSIEIVIIDGERRFGNQKLLPAGPLRESVSRLKKVNFIITNGNALAGEYAMQLKTGMLHNVMNSEQRAINDFAHKHVHAVAAIGNPQRFFNTLRKLGFEIVEHIFPDHHLFQEKDLIFKDNNPVIMTEKDAVKCISFAKPDFWYLPVTAEMEKRFEDEFLKRFNAPDYDKLNSH